MRYSTSTFISTGFDSANDQATILLDSPEALGLAELRGLPASPVAWEEEEDEDDDELLDDDDDLDLGEEDDEDFFDDDDEDLDDDDEEVVDEE